jgi:hypothetical protein
MALIRAISDDEEADHGRSPYPYIGSVRSLQLAETIRDLGGTNSEVSKSLIAHRLGVDEQAATLTQSLSAAKTFGLISGRGTYRITDLAKRCLSTDKAESRRARIEMLKRPTIFEDLISRFDGSKLPANETLVELVKREHKVAESWRNRVVQLFASSIRDAGIVDSGGFLRYSASMLAEEVPAVAVPANESMSARQPTDAAGKPVRMVPQFYEPQNRPAADPGVDVWSIKIGNESVRLETSRELSISMWEKLHKYVQVLKPEVESVKQ